MRDGSLSTTRRGLLRGAGGLALMASLGPEAAWAATEQTLKIIHGRLDTDWSPLRGGGSYSVWNSLWSAAPMYFDPQANVHPYVFANWTSNDDKTVWTFQIDPNAVFSDGSQITADDVKGSFELAAHPATKHQRIDQVFGGVVGFNEVLTGQTTAMSGLKALDGAVEITLAAPNPIFHLHIANHLVPIVKIDLARDSDGAEVFEWWHPDNGVVVAGPYIPIEMDLDSGVVVLDRNSRFFKGSPKLERIEITTVTDPVVATLMLQQKKAHAHTWLLTQSVVKDLGKAFVEGPLIPRGHHFWFDMSRKPMDDVNVRKALILAIDRDELLRVSFPDGPHPKADQILDAVPGADGFASAYPYDPEGARAALAASSYGGPEKLPRLMMVGISNPANELAAQYIAEQWRQVLGVQAVEIKPQMDAYSGPDQNQVQIFRDDVGTRIPDAVAYLRGAIHSSSGNAKTKLGGFADPEIDRLLDEAAMLDLEDARRIGNALEAQRRFMDLYAFLPWYHEVNSRFTLPGVANMEKNLDWQIPEPWAISIG